jgi:hypothetical protein
MYRDSVGKTLEDYPRPSVAVDTAVLTVDPRSGLGVLLVRREGSHRRDAWALPGTCADVSVATLLERDRSLRRVVTRVGERHLLLGPAGEPKARAALRVLGYPLGSGTG